MAKQHYHFIGIGGIGMSALARMLLHEGHTVSGSDRARSDLTEQLEQEGISIVYEQTAENITDDIDRIVYTIALPEDHPELQEARKKEIPAATYPEMLGEVSKDKYTIAIAGTHGKTTTTAMVAHILEQAELDPTVIVGSLLWGNNTTWGSNFVAGTSKYFVVEACEYKRSFIHLHPDILVITNIEEDHLDYYESLTDIQAAFNEIAERVPEDGVIVCSPRSDTVMPVVSRYHTKVIDYTEISEDGISLSVPGKHNIANAQAALAATQFIGVDRTVGINALGTFKGTWRRFEHVGELESGALVYDDYAHHPSEISATIAAFREKFPDRKLRVIFQPHLFSRTEQLLDEIAKSLSDADDIIVAPIYAAREEPLEGVDHHALARAIEKQDPDASVQALDSFDAIEKYISEEDLANDVVVTMGAGDINTLHTAIVRRK